MCYRKSDTEQVVPRERDSLEERSQHMSVTDWKACKMKVKHYINIRKFGNVFTSHFPTSDARQMIDSFRWSMQKINQWNNEQNWVKQRDRDIGKCIYQANVKSMFVPVRCAKCSKIKDQNQTASKTKRWKRKRRKSVRKLVKRYQTVIFSRWMASQRGARAAVWTIHAHVTVNSSKLSPQESPNDATKWLNKVIQFSRKSLV